MPTVKELQFLRPLLPFVSNIMNLRGKYDQCGESVPDLLLSLDWERSE
jgi:hypothetical protein